MKQREYRIIIHSITRFILAMTVILCSSFFLIKEYTPRIDSKFIFFLQFLAIFFSSIYLSHLLAMSKVKVLLSEEGFFHIWERRFILSWEKNLKIMWAEIDNYVFQEDRTNDSFIINLSTKRKYKIDRLNFLPLKDDFNKLLKDFPRLSNEFKEGRVSNYNVTIKEGKTIYESKSFKWAFYIMSGGYLILLIVKILDPEKGSTWSSLGVIGCAIFFYRAMILRKKKNN
jgi:hypothetical protein